MNQIFKNSRSLFGQNDYIDILGSDELHPTDIMYHVPKYLRGQHRRKRHVQVAIERRKALEHTGFPKAYPKTWEDWNKQVKKSYNSEVVA